MTWQVLHWLNFGHTPNTHCVLEPATSRDKLNKQVFDLTKKRKTSGVDKFDLAIDGAKLVPIIEQKIKQFSETLKSEYKHFQCGTEPLELVPALSAMSSTTLVECKATVQIRSY